MEEKLFSYWPTQENVDECIRPEAETDDLSVLLAVHQPVRFLQISFSNPDNKKPSTEKDLLKTFLTPHLPSGTMLLPIIGSSGIGKSHIIRWLDAQIRRQKDAVKRHIIRIPKSSSLKDVLTLILKDIRGSEYDKIRKTLSRSQEQMSVERAIELLRAELLDALREKSKIVQNRILETKNQGKIPESNDIEIYEFAGKKGLPVLLKDIELEKHFVSGSLTRIAKRFVEGLQAGEEPKTQFFEEDLTFTEVALDHAAREARIFYNHINRTGKDYKEIAVNILNDVDVIDKALNQLFEKDTNTSLKDIFLKIREQLLVEKTELILLVEDFAALAGVQGALLDIIIKEGIRDGEQILCPMRTALAVTEGYPIPDTVRTRAIENWLIEDVPDTRREVTLELITDFIGGYLNAARLGKDELKRQYKDPKKNDLVNWVKNFVESNELTSDLADIIDEFGKSKQRFHLFPFNREAIERFAIKYLSTPDGVLAFNPRTVINDILRKVLLDYRKDFINGKFPPPNLLRAELTAIIQKEIYHKIQDTNQQRQFISLLHFWGGNPSHIDEVNCISEGICRAFNLPSLFIGKSGGTGPGKDTGTITGMGATTGTGSGIRTETEQHPSEYQNWVEILDKWARGKEIPQRQSNELRKWIRDGIKANIDWDRELLAPMELDQKLIYIPAARGGQAGLLPSKAMVIVADDDVHSDPHQSTNLRINLQAIIKFNIKKSWDFDESEESIARYANFIEKLTKQAVKYCHSNYLKIEGDVVPVLAQAAFIGARVLNLSKSHNNDKFSNLFSMLHPSDTNIIEYEDSARWNYLQKSCQNIRSHLLGLLLQYVGARQGGGKKVLAVDGIRLLEAIDDSFKSKWYLNETILDGPNEFNNIKNHLISLNKRNLSISFRELQTHLLDWLTKIDAFFGEKFDKPEIVETLKNILSKTKTSGLYRGNRDYNSLRKSDIPFFRDCALNENINLIRELSKDSGIGKILSVLAQANISVITKISKLIDDLDDFLEKVNQDIDTKLNTIGEDSITNVVEDINHDLNEMSNLFIRVQGKKANDN